VLALAALVGCGRRLPVDQPPDLAAARQIRDGFQASVGDGGETPAATTQQPTGWATLRGVFKLGGTAPAPLPLKVDKDLEVCAPGSRPVYSEQVVVDDATRGIANVVIYADGVPAEWLHDDAKAAVAEEVIFDQKECTFLTHVLGMFATQRLKILNSDPIGHNTNLSPRNSAPFNQTIPAGGHTTYQPQGEEREPFSVVCSIHPWMQAWIITRSNGYFAVTGPDGTFEIPNLPAGVDLEFRVWQEKANFLQDVSVNGQPARWARGRLPLRLDAEDEAKNRLDVQVDVSVFQ